MLLAAFLFSQSAALSQAESAVDLSREALSIPPVDLEPPHFARIEPDTDKGSNQSDYLNDVLTATRGRVFRYKTMPIRIYFQPTDPVFMQASLAACHMWETRSHNLVRFQPVTAAEKARITVEWEHQGVNPSQQGSTHGGHTWSARAQKPVTELSPENVNLKSTIQVIPINLDIVAERVPEQQPILLRNILVHELGHALGLIGHSQDRADIMYKDTDEYSRISQRDLNTLDRLYRLPVNVPL